MSYGGLGISLKEYEGLSFQRRATYIRLMTEQKEKENREIEKGRSGAASNR